MEELARALESSIQTAVERAVEKAFSKYEIGVPTKEVGSQSKYYTTKQLTEKLDISLCTVYRWEKEKRIKSIIIKGKKMYERDVIDRLYSMGEIGKYCRQ